MKQWLFRWMRRHWIALFVLSLATHAAAWVLSLNHVRTFPVEPPQYIFGHRISYEASMRLTDFECAAFVSSVILMCLLLWCRKPGRA
jgi:hypothetical protein